MYSGGEVGMEFVSIRDMRTRPGEVWQQLQEQGDLVVTSNGRPFALLINAEGQDVEELLLAVRRARALLAIERLRAEAAENGTDQLTAEEIEAEIAAARRERRR
jgi:antitoxin (DNA-binding transcriptional repressor) of toxin-antitoxin stability system